MRWSFEFHLEGVLAAIGRPLEGSSGADQEEILTAELAVSDRDGGGRSADLAGVVAENLPAGPGVAAWLSQQVPAGAADRDLAGLATAQVSLELATGAIDLYRAKVIAEATTALSQEAARAVEAMILPAAGDMTYAPRCGGR